MQRAYETPVTGSDVDDAEFQAVQRGCADEMRGLTEFKVPRSEYLYP
jgi:hypothetical protein